MAASLRRKAKDPGSIPEINPRNWTHTQVRVAAAYGESCRRDDLGGAAGHHHCPSCRGFKGSPRG